ncbi:hypothetical protein [Streptomyces sp. NBC_00690]|uniref:hypothetical protein n=1 Tax=Streptomyces sp. NBC_00690 TaxID=2975808 RepID=UPI002E2C7F6E|nr:hypothetical protein [Streptomyces sp. NBC_00690]
MLWSPTRAAGATAVCGSRAARWDAAPSAHVCVCRSGLSGEANEAIVPLQAEELGDVEVAAPLIDPVTRFARAYLREAAS